MPTCFEYDENGELAHWFDLGEAECPRCGAPTIGHYQNGVLIGMEPCFMCPRPDRADIFDKE